MLNNLKMLGGGGAKSSIKQGKRAFTYVEVILAIALIVFLWLFVFQENRGNNKRT